MAQFIGDIAFLLELFAVASGIILLGKAQGTEASVHFRIAAWLLVLGGALTALCTGYYYFAYWTQGGFDSAYLQDGIAQVTALT